MLSWRAAGGEALGNLLLGVLRRLLPRVHDVCLLPRPFWRMARHSIQVYVQRLPLCSVLVGSCTSGEGGTPRFHPQHLLEGTSVSIALRLDSRFECFARTISVFEANRVPIDPVSKHFSHC